ncbi:hypothetical protein [Cryptosporangium sp. NPDC051539]|uniref:hypothetical protein n=1 Tax=Cryptosporangium sp. NPDC051539 TaxID=3363962 RepID=UPI0037950851
MENRALIRVTIAGFVVALLVGVVAWVVLESRFDTAPEDRSDRPGSTRDVSTTPGPDEPPSPGNTSTGGAEAIETPPSSGTDADDGTLSAAPPASPTTETSPSTADTNRARPDPTTTRSPVGGGSRQGQRPAGIPDQLDYYAGGGRPCELIEQLIDTSITQIFPMHATLTGPVLVPDTLDLCLVAFDPNSSIQLRLTGPSGAVVLDETLAPEGTDLPFRLWPYRTLILDGQWTEGRYHVQATQGATQRSIDIDVAYTRVPTLVSIFGESGYPPDNSMFVTGETVRVALGGFPASSTVPVRLYGNRTDVAHPLTYLRSIPVTTDAHGQARLSIPVDANLPRGCYRIFQETVSADDEWVNFCVGQGE